MRPLILPVVKQSIFRKSPAQSSTVIVLPVQYILKYMYMHADHHYAVLLQLYTHMGGPQTIITILF